MYYHNQFRTRLDDFSVNLDLQLENYNPLGICKIELYQRDVIDKFNLYIYNYFQRSGFDDNIYSYSQRFEEDKLCIHYC